MRLKTLLLLTIFGLFTVTVNGQFSHKDFIIKTSGLSDEYASRYTDSLKVKELITAFNQFRITHDIAPITITINYENGEGYVLAEINYIQDKIFADNSEYSTHNKNIKSYSVGSGISVFLQHQIFTALTQYKRSVATNGMWMDKDLLKFESAIKLKKPNGDWMLFYSYNHLDSNGFYPYTFYKNVHMQVAGKKYETETSNLKMLNDMKFFFAGKTIGIDGNKTGAYYFCKFFNIESK